MKAKVTNIKNSNGASKYVSGSRLAVIDQTFRLYERGYNLTRDYHGGQIAFPKSAVPAMVTGDDKHSSIYLSR